MKKSILCKNEAKIGEGDLQSFYDWMQALIFIFFPENPIEYWYLGPEKKELTLSERSTGFRTPYCFVRQGHSEGYIIEFGLMMKDQTVVQLFTAKALSQQAKCWEIASTAQFYMELFFLYGQVPCIMGFRDALKPHLQDAKRADVNPELQAGPHGYAIKIGDTEVFRNEDPQTELSARYAWHDWDMVCKAMNLTMKDVAYHDQESKQSNPLFKVSLSGDHEGGDETVQFFASEVLRHHMPGSAYGWEDLSEQDQESFVEDFALYQSKRRFGDHREYRVQILN